jgi:hypothetical protein
MWKLNSKDLAMNGLGGAEDVSSLRDRLFEFFLDTKSFEAVGSLEPALFDLSECKRNRPSSNSKSEVLNLYGYEKEGSLSRFSSVLESLGDSDFETSTLVGGRLLGAAENVK